MTAMYNLLENKSNWKSMSIYKEDLVYASYNPLVYPSSSASFKLKFKTHGSIPAASKVKHVPLSVLLNYFSNYWRTLTLEMSLIYHKVNLLLSYYGDYIMTIVQQLKTEKLWHLQ